MTRRRFITILSMVFVLALTTTTALAGQPRLSSFFSATVGSIEVEVKAVGLGSGTPVFFGLEAFGTGTAQCKNPAGKVVPGKQAVSVVVDSFSDVIFASDSGNASVTLVAEATVPSPKAAGCPKGFSVDVFNVNWTGAIVTLYPAIGQPPAPDLEHPYDQQEYTCNTTDTSPGAAIKCKPIQ
jgi:hypothetical protein